MAVNYMPQAEADEKIKEAFDAAAAKLLTQGARIIILGATGAGKTSVLNAAFNETRSRVGHGIPCTHVIKEFSPTAACPVWLYDSKGFEPLSDNKDIFDAFTRLKEERSAAAKQHDTQTPEHQIERLHAVWWVTSERFELDCAKRVHETFGEEIPIFILLNKCDKDSREVDSNISEVASYCPWAREVIPIVATPKNGPLRKLCPACGVPDISVHASQGWFMCHNDSCDVNGKKQMLQAEYGIGHLLKSTVEALPALVALSFHEASKKNLHDLDWIAYRQILIHASVAVGIGAVPIPCSDMPLLLANEVAMFVKLAKVYGIRVKPAVAKTVIDAYIRLGVSATEGLVLGSVLKFIPGVGPILGGALDTSLALFVTMSFGMTLKIMFRRVRDFAVYGEATFEEFKMAMKVDEAQEHFNEQFERHRNAMSARDLPPTRLWTRCDAVGHIVA